MFLPTDILITSIIVLIFAILLVYGVIKKDEGAIFFSLVLGCVVAVMGYGAFGTDVNEEKLTPLVSEQYEYSKTDRWLFISYRDLTYQTSDVYLYNNIEDSTAVGVYYSEGIDSYGRIVDEEIVVKPKGE